MSTLRVLALDVPKVANPRVVRGTLMSVMPVQGRDRSLSATLSHLSLWKQIPSALAHPLTPSTFKPSPSSQGDYLWHVILPCSRSWSHIKTSYSFTHNNLPYKSTHASRYLNDSQANKFTHSLTINTSLGSEGYPLNTYHLLAGRSGA